MSLSFVRTASHPLPLDTVSTQRLDEQNYPNVRQCPGYCSNSKAVNCFETHTHYFFGLVTVRFQRNFTCFHDGIYNNIKICQDPDGFYQVVSSLFLVYFRVFKPHSLPTKNVLINWQQCCSCVLKNEPHKLN